MSKDANVRITSELKNPSELGTHHRLLCMTGPNKGKVYYLLGKRIIIGRGESADIQIVDTKISREHAELSYAESGYTITDLGAQNGIIVNDAKVKQKKLADNEKVVIGQTVMKYNIIEVSNEVAVVDDDDDSVGPVREMKIPKTKAAKSNSSSFDHSSSSKRNNSSAEAKSGGGNKMIIMIVIVGAVLYALMGPSDTPPSKAGRSNAQTNIDQEFSTTQVKTKSPEDAEVKRKLENLIHSGRREFSEGNYFRAMEDFRLALLLNPNDGHASFYLSKAKQSLDEDIRKNFEKGKQEHESKKFQAALVSYCSVIQLIQNYPNDERYKNAQLAISAIEAELGMEKGEVKCIEAKSNEPKN